MALKWVAQNLFKPSGPLKGFLRVPCRYNLPGTYNREVYGDVCDCMQYDVDSPCQCQAHVVERWYINPLEQIRDMAQEPKKSVS